MRSYSMTCKATPILSACTVGLFAVCLSGSVQAGALNDTGVTGCSNGTTAVACSSVDATHPGQDASFGRDAAAATGALTKTGAGPAGFDFTKLSFDGTAVADSAVIGAGVGQHACTRDNVTGLVWDVLLGKTNVFWHDSNSATNGGNPGYIGAGSHTQIVVNGANASGQCGGTGWRLPTVRELLSISDIGQGKRPTGYFTSNHSETSCPEMGEVWSSQTYRGLSSHSWVVRQGGGLTILGKSTLSVFHNASGSCPSATYPVYVMIVR